MVDGRADPILLVVTGWPQLPVGTTNRCAIAPAVGRTVCCVAPARTSSLPAWIDTGRLVGRRRANRHAPGGRYGQYLDDVRIAEAMNGILLSSDRCMPAAIHPRSLPSFVRPVSIPPTHGCKDSQGKSPCRLCALAGLLLSDAPLGSLTGWAKLTGNARW